MTNIITFSFQEKPIRVVNIDGEPYWIGKDVAEVLGYTNPNKAIGDHCKGVTKRYPLQTEGGIQEFRVLSEGDVLRLIVNSKLPAAVQFERLVFDEILLTIRTDRGAIDNVCYFAYNTNAVVKAARKEVLGGYKKTNDSPIFGRRIESGKSTCRQTWDRVFRIYPASVNRYSDPRIGAVSTAQGNPRRSEETHESKEMKNATRFTLQVTTSSNVQ